MTRDPVNELLAGYGAGTDEERADLARIAALVGRADRWHRSAPVHLTASAVIVHPPTARVLLRWHQRQQAWLYVGGHADAGEEDPLAIALREGCEETGLDDLVPWPDARLVHVAVVSVAPGAREPAHEHADLRFVLATGRPDEVRPEKPEAALRWLGVDEARPEVRGANSETLARVAHLLSRRSLRSRGAEAP